MLLLNIKTLAGKCCALPPCLIKGFRKYAGLFKEVILLSVLCTPTLIGRKVLILQGCNASLREESILQEKIFFKEVVSL
jgi:hypothetical protein